MIKLLKTGFTSLYITAILFFYEYNELYMHKLPTYPINRQNEL